MQNAVTYLGPSFLSENSLLWAMPMPVQDNGFQHVLVDGPDGSEVGRLTFRPGKGWYAVRTAGGFDEADRGGVVRLNGGEVIYAATAPLALELLA